MDYDALLDLVADLGYSLAMSGAETYRVEDSINRILHAYGVESEVWAIPNCMTISMRTGDGRLLTRMKRIGFHGNDLDAVEKYNSVSRRICSEKPNPKTAAQWLKETHEARTQYNLPMFLLGNILGAAGFAVFFGGTVIDALCAGLCAVLLGLTDKFLNKFKTNPFFRTIACSFIMSVVAYLTGVLGICDNADMVIIGTLMILVPGLIITNAMRDIIFGDTNSGINRIVQVFLVAAAIALGTGAAWSISAKFWGTPVNTDPLVYSSIIQVICCIVACIGFGILFNIHGPGGLLCVLGGGVAWAGFCLAEYLGAGELVCYFVATLVAAVYSEIMARVRKFPTISYLVISIFPLIPGAGIYYTTNYLVAGDMIGFAGQGKHTVAIAGVIAVGILMVSTFVRLWYELQQSKR